MKVEMIYKNLELTIFGFSGVAVNKDYAGRAFQLMDKMWRTVKEKGLKHRGINIWVYEQDERVFAGVELEDSRSQDPGMEKKAIHLTKYAYFKHVGPYHLLKRTGQNMRDELRHQGMETCFPFIEIYGHWTNDESRLETELIICLK